MVNSAHCPNWEVIDIKVGSKDNLIRFDKLAGLKSAACTFIQVCKCTIIVEVYDKFSVFGLYLTEDYLIYM